MGVGCVIPSCKSKYRKGSNITFHKFPFGKPEKLKVWSDIISPLKPAEWKPLRSQHICSVHFEEKHIYRLSHAKVTLREEAVPTLYLHETYAGNEEGRNDSRKTCVTYSGTSSRIIERPTIILPKYLAIPVSELIRDCEEDSRLILPENIKKEVIISEEPAASPVGDDVVTRTHNYCKNTTAILNNESAEKSNIFSSPTYSESDTIRQTTRDESSASCVKVSSANSLLAQRYIKLKKRHVNVKRLVKALRDKRAISEDVFHLINNELNGT